MKKLQTLILIFVTLPNLATVSIGQSASVEKMNGIWQFIPNNRGDSLLSIDYRLFRKNKNIDITYWRKTKKADTYGNPFSYFGFHDGETRGYPNRLTDLDNSGHNIFFYDDLGQNYDRLGNLLQYSARTCWMSYNEDEKPNHEPAVLRFYYKGIPDVYVRAKAIPDSILIVLKRNPKSWQNYVAFVGMIRKKVRAKRATVLLPHQ